MTVVSVYRRYWTCHPHSQKSYGARTVRTGIRHGKTIGRRTITIAHLLTEHATAIGTALMQKGEPMSDLISRQAAIDAIIAQNGVVDKSVAKRILIQLPSAEPWDVVKTMLKELEQKEEKLYADYCDTTARLKAINKIAESSQAPRQKIDGIKPLAKMEAEDE